MNAVRGASQVGVPRVAAALRSAACAVSCFAAVALLATTAALAQPASGDDTAQRLQAEKEGKNTYRGGAESFDKVKQIMKEQLFPKILASSEGDSKADEWYSPHLRDMLIKGTSRFKEAEVRAKTTPPDVWMCLFPPPFWVPPRNFTACPLGPCGLPHVWHGEPFGQHRPIEACFTAPTFVYGTFVEDTNFKACCVRDPEVFLSSEEIAARHPDGSGWAGLFEYYYPTTAFGWENDRSTTMIVGKDEQQRPQQCLEDSDLLMEGEQAVNWVTGAIERNKRAAERVGAGGSGGGGDDVRQTVQDVIRDVRPEDKELRFTDSLQSQGLTLRPNFAAMEVEYRRMLARRFCMREEQFLKLMDPQYDTLQLSGGPDVNDLKNLPVWANYCPLGVNLMTDPEKSALENIDETPTDFVKGMTAWRDDPQFCQRMLLGNQRLLNDPNIQEVKLEEVLRESGSEEYTPEQVGYTCLNQDDQEGGGASGLNGSLVPVELNRYAASERRADVPLGFLISAGLAEGMREPGSGPYKKSYYKRFEPRPYSRDHLPFWNRAFVGERFKGGGFNEVFQQCQTISGKDYHQQNKSDQLYISDYTHPVFTEDKIVNQEGRAFNRFRGDWAKPGQENEIANRGLDEKSSNYAAAFRIFATCPRGYSRWRPPEHDEINLRDQLLYNCREENFGGRTRPDF